MKLTLLISFVLASPVFRRNNPGLLDGLLGGGRHNDGLLGGGNNRILNDGGLLGTGIGGSRGLLGTGLLGNNGLGSKHRGHGGHHGRGEHHGRSRNYGHYDHDDYDYDNDYSGNNHYYEPENNYGY